MELPTQKVLASSADPAFMILFGKQKAGKTTILAQLPNSLILDFEEGTVYMDAVAIKIKDFDHLVEVKNALEEKMKSTGKKPYKRIIFDTATTLEEMLMPYAISLYKATPMGAAFKGTTLRNLPQGAGYLQEREAFKNVITGFHPYCDTFILSGHVADKQITKDGKEVWELEIDLTGKLKRIMGAKADAIGYIYRKGNQCIVSFKGGKDVIVESRIKHLTNKDIVISESTGEGEDIDIKVYWDRIFKNL